MINTRINQRDMISTYCLHQDNRQFAFSITSPRDFLPSYGLFAIITMDSNLYEHLIDRLFRILINTTYQFNPIDEIFGDQQLKGYCIYGISFKEAMSIGLFSSRSAILYSDLECIGYYDKDSCMPVYQINFSK